MPVVQYYFPDSSLYVYFDDGTAVELIAPVTAAAHEYRAEDDAIEEAGLSAGVHSGSVQIGDFENPSPYDLIVGVVSNFIWDGTNEVLEFDLLDDIIDDLNDITTTLGTITSALGTLQTSVDNIEFGDVDNTEVIEILREIQGSDFLSAFHSLYEIARKLGLGVAPDSPIDNDGAPPAAGIAITEIWNVSTGQVPINYSSMAPPGVSTISPNRSGSLYLQPANRIIIETQRLVSSQINDLKSAGLIEVYRRIKAI